MELNQVRYFLALAKTLNFTRAAAQCRVSQPALTKAIQKLETEFDGVLIHRERQLTQLTDLGTLVLPMLERLLAAAETVEVQAREYRDNGIGVLRLGLAPDVSAALLVQPLTQLVAFVPGLQLDVAEVSADRLVEALLEGEIHAWIGGATETGAERVDHWRLFDERYVALVSTRHPFASLAVVPLPLVEQAVWLERTDCEMAARFRRSCFASGATPRIVHRGGHVTHLQHMAAAGLGAMLAPEHCPRLANLVARPIEGDPLRREVELFVVAGRRHSPALRTFVRMARVRDWQVGGEAADTIVSHSAAAPLPLCA